MLLLSKNDYCQFFLNGHLSRTDTWCWPLSFFNDFTVTKLSIRQTPLSDGQRILLKLSLDNWEALNVVKNTSKPKCRAVHDIKL